MTKVYPKRVGGFDSTTMPRGKPTGVSGAMNIAASLEGGADISKSFGPAAPNPPRGSRTPAREVRVTRHGSGQTTTRTEN
jgi:hypothetical protein